MHCVHLFFVWFELLQFNVEVIVVIYVILPLPRTRKHPILKKSVLACFIYRDVLTFIMQNTVCAEF